MITITKKQDCCGCTACSNVCSKNAIKMVADAEGFLYPKINADLCNNCGLCEKVCPIINKVNETVTKQHGYVVQNKDSKVLKESTSGGAFTAIAEYVIKKGGIVFGAAFDNDFRVIHTSAESVSDLRKFRNSKYVQSDPNDTFRQVRSILKTGRLVCYSGTPCQIEGLKSFLINDYENLITIDVVCHAVPSPLIWEKYKSLFTDEGGITKAAFRDKTHYGYEYSQMAMDTKKQHYHQGVETDPFLRAFFSDLSDRPSCYSCAFKKRYRESDVTIWDCFEPDKFDKKLDNNAGVTRILTHSDKGVKMISGILDSFYYTKVSADKLVEGVNEMYHSVSMNPRRKEFFVDAQSMENRAFFEKYFPDTPKVKVERFVRHISEKMGIYKIVKKTAKKLLRK